MTRFRMLAAVVALAILFATVGQTHEKKIAMTPVTYDGLKQEVLKQRGKVLVVDLWASFCVPCVVKGFPRMQEMHEKYGKQGLSVVTVAIDDPTDAEAIEHANQILSKNNVPFRNVNLTDPGWQKLFGIKTIPCYYVFDRNGRWLRFGGGVKGVDYDELEKTVVQMLHDQ